MHRTFRPIVMAGLLTLTASLAMTQPQGKPATDDRTGPSVGTVAPEFTLKDQNGQERKLADFLGKGKVALVFYRSADW